MAIAEVSIVPLGTKTPSVSQYVARAVKVLEREKGIKYETTAMGTIIEGDLDRILAAVKKMHEGTFVEGVARVITTVEIGKITCAIQGIYDPKPIGVILEKTAFLGEQAVVRIMSLNLFNN